MQLFRSRWQWFLVVGGVIALAPLLMAPQPGACPSCSIVLASWEGALDPQESAPHQYSVQSGKWYIAYLGVNDGSATLSVTGQVVSQLQCGAGQSQGDSQCVFRASANGTITMTVTGGGQGAEYLLGLGYP